MCDREDFCSTCVKYGLAHCSYYAEDGAAIIRHYPTPEDVPAKYQAYTCPACDETGQTCSDGVPCTQCLEGFMSTHRRFQSCTKRIGPTTVIKRERAAYTFQRNEHNYIDSDSVTRDPQYKGTLPDARKQTTDKGGFLDKDVPEDDPEAVAFAAVLPSSADDLTFATEDDRLDGDMLDYLSDNDYDRRDDDEGFLRDDDLNMFALTAPNAILDIRTPTSYKEAMTLPEAAH